MSSAPAHADRPVTEPIETYRILCFAALGVISFVLYVTDSGPFAVLPAVVGALVLIRVSNFGAVLLLLTLAGVMEIRAELLFRIARSVQDRPGDLIIAVATLVYVAGYYRLRSLRSHIFPVVPPARPQPGRKREKPRPQARTPALVTIREIGQLLIQAPVWVLLAVAFWALFTGVIKRHMAPPFWFNVWLIWTLGAIFLLPAAVIAYLAWRRMSSAEALVFLQDVIWAETRREQRRLNRWLAWARMRRRRRADKRTPEA